MAKTKGSMDMGIARADAVPGEQTRQSTGMKLAELCALRAFPDRKLRAPDSF